MSNETCFLIIFVLLISPSVCYRYYLRKLPNSDQIPFCPTQGPCYNTNVCAAYGHQDCSASSGRTDFGNAVKRIGSGRWNYNLCILDSDGDGKTNGDEVGDPCCEWQTTTHIPSNASQSSQTTLFLSNPSYAASTTPRASCYLSGAPLAIPAGNIAVTDQGATWVSLSWVSDWDATRRNISCTCATALTLTPTSGSSATLSFQRAVPPLTICGLTSGVGYTLALTPRNLAGTSPQTSYSISASASGGAAPSCYVDPSAPPSAGTVTSSDPLMPMTSYGMFAAFAILGFLLLAGLFLTRGCCFGCCCCVVRCACVDEGGCLRRNCIHKPLCISSLSSKCLRWVFGDDLARMPRAALIVWPLLWGVLVALYVGAYTFYSVQIYPYGHAQPGARAMGFVSYAALSLTLLPVSKYSIWPCFFGVSVERAILYHRWLAVAFILCAWTHGLWMLASLTGNAVFGGAAYVWQWDTNNEVNPLPGTIIGFLLLVLVCTAFMRRSFYTLFLTLHWLLFPAVIILVILHTPSLSIGTPILLVIPGFILLGLDLIFVLGDLFVRPTRVLFARTSASGDVVELVCNKSGLQWLSGPEPAGFVYVFVPSLSMIPHPVSMCGVGRKALAKLVAGSPASDGAVRADELVVLRIKRMGESSWTSKLADRLGAAPHQGVASASTSRTVTPGITENPMHKERANTPLAASLSASAASQQLPRIFLLGPFGRMTTRINSYSHFVLIGAGIGITPVTNLWHVLMQRLRTQITRTDTADRARDGDEVAIRSVSMLWCARDLELVNMVLENDDELDIAAENDVERQQHHRHHHHHHDVAGSGKTLTSSGNSSTQLSTTPVLASAGAIAGTGGGSAGAVTLERTKFLPESVQQAPNGAVVSRSVYITGGGTSRPTPANWNCLSGRPDWAGVFRGVSETVLRQQGVPVSVPVCVFVCGPGELVDQVTTFLASLPSSGVDFDVHTETFLL